MNKLAKLVLVVFIVFFLCNNYLVGAKVKILSINYNDGTPPNPPQIEGPTNCKMLKEYTYNITITDPDGDRLTELDVKFGDGKNLTLKPPESGCCKGWRSGLTLTVSHRWKASGNFSVEAKVRDFRWNWSEWGILNVHISKNKPYINTPFLNFLENHPHLFPLIRLLLNLPEIQ